MNKNLFILLIAFFFVFNSYAQHPNSFRYNGDTRKYTISGGERSAVKSSIQKWFATHDTVGTLVKIYPVIFSPDYKTLPVCDSIASAKSYHKEKFMGFPASNNGGFFGVDIILKNKQGVNERYTVDVSYSFEVVRVWFQDRILYKVKN
jgi:hypothetical protein